MITNAKTMGVINLTPDSFSDGGNSYNPAGVKQRLQELLSWKVDVLDIGAESTAPFNKGIGEDVELSRFERLLFPVLPDFNLDSFPSISIDTFRPRTFLSLYRALRTDGFRGKIIWNDVSGVVDEETLTTLKECNDIDYVLSYTRLPSKEVTSNHMQFVDERMTRDQLFSDMTLFFRQKCEQLEQAISRQQVIYDPCFGFSKTKEQNWWLIEDFPALTQELSDHTFLVGISKKSFLQAMVQETLPENHPKMTNKSFLQSESELLHAQILTFWKRCGVCNHLIVRVHNPVVNALSNKFLHSLGN